MTKDSTTNVRTDEPSAASHEPDSGFHPSAESQSADAWIRKPQRRVWAWLLAAGLIAVIVGGVVVARSMNSRAALASGAIPVANVTRNDIVIKVAEAGSLESASNVTIKCKLLGGGTIQSIVVDGTEVQEGDELVRLDSSALDEQSEQQKIVVERARAVVFQAKKTHSLSEVALTEYLEGTFVKELQDADSVISVAEENLRSAENSLMHTRVMARKGYATPLQLETQEFAVRHAEIDLAAAHTSRMVLTEFTKAKMLEDLQSQRDTAAALVRSEEATLRIEESRLARIREQLANCVYTAPRAGMVVFANDNNMFSRGETAPRIEEGARVYEQQTLIRLPDLGQMQAKVAIEESRIETVEIGMPARLTMQGREFRGTVVEIAKQPAPSTSFYNSSVRKYMTTIRIEDQPPGLKPGMTADVEITTLQRPRVLSLPVEAVLEQGSGFFVWTKEGSRLERRPIMVGVNDAKWIEIVDGVAEDQQVVLNPWDNVPEARMEYDDPAGAQKMADRFGVAQQP